MLIRSHHAAMIEKGIAAESPSPGRRDYIVRDPIWIPLSDGTRLAATIRLPLDADSRPVPAILEYLPYRRRDGTIKRDTEMHGWFAAHGYAGVRVDMRGTGDSEGVLRDEYLPQEQADAVEVIAWLAKQPWCTGSVGMMGISWGGFNALQVAALRPKALKAIVTVCSTDDRYGGDCHWEGGLLLNGNLAWGATAFQFAAQPPDPAIVGERWREMWRSRLEELELFLAEWIAHQNRDAYWKQGSVCEDYKSVEAAVYAISGFADPYTNAVPRLLKNLACPRKGLIGPWGHNYGHVASPGPRMDFLGELKRWFDHWLKGIDTGLMKEPMIHVWMQDSQRPSAVITQRPGKWISLNGWPDAGKHHRRYHFSGSSLAEAKSHGPDLFVNSPLETGTSFGEWCPYSGDGELPIDQRPDDGRSVCLDSKPLEQPLEFVGAPVVQLSLKAGAPTGAIAVRLCDVYPDGSSALVSYGLLNLAHRHGHERPLPLDLTSYELITVRLNDKAHRFAAGQRIRLALSTSFWPATWPLAETAPLSIATADSFLDLPMAEALPAKDAFLFAPPQLGPQEPLEMTESAGRTRTLVHDTAIDLYRLECIRGRGAYRILATDTFVERKGGESYEITAGAPLSARAEAWGDWSMQRGDWRVRTTSRIYLNCTAQSIEIRASLEALEGDLPFASRHFSRSIPRKLV